jgi:phosphoribosylaminoimidazole-succinocarboxamide synthase
MQDTLMNTDLPGLKLLSKGKVRDIYETSSTDHLLFVATDRISAYDVILRNVRLVLSVFRLDLFIRIQGIPGKGKLLTQISKFWFERLASIVPNHFVTDNIDEMPEEVRQYKDRLDGCAMLVKKATVIPMEAIVRGYLTGA